MEEYEPIFKCGDADVNYQAATPQDFPRISSHNYRQETGASVYEERSKAPGRKLGLIVMLLFINYCNGVCYSLLAPFFPKLLVEPTVPPNPRLDRKARSRTAFMRRRSLIKVFVGLLYGSMALQPNGWTAIQLLPRLCLIFAVAAGRVVQKGGSQALASWIFGTYQLVIFLVCPVFGTYVRKIGRHFLFVAGSVITGVSCALFGFVPMTRNFAVFVTMAFCVRIVEAVGAGAYLTASLCIAAGEFPDQMATVLGMLEMACGVGISTGPAIGGALYAAGKYWTPFVTMGTILVSIGLFSIPVLRKYDKDPAFDRASPGSHWKLLKNKGVIIACVVVVFGSMSIGFYEPTLGLHIDPFLSSPFQVGAVFVASGATYALSSPIWGAIADRISNPKILMLIGCLLVGLAFVLLGPAPFLGLKPRLSLVIFALLLHGIGVGAQLVPPLRDILTEAIKCGLPSNAHIIGLISGLFGSMFSLGAFLGPLIGGSLIDVISFEWSAFLISLMDFFLAAVLLGYMMPKCYRRITNDMAFC